jgi:hypothetical protein
VRDEVAKLDSSLARIIDNCSPGKDLYLYRATYPFGETIFDKADLFLPDNRNHYVSINSPSHNNKLRHDFNGRNIPVGLIMQHGSEVYIEIGQKVIPLTVFPAGKFFGIWEALDPAKSYFAQQAWTMTSGARSLFLLPKISEIRGYNRLKRAFNIRAAIPDQINKHWQLFKEIVNSDEFIASWNCHLLFFPERWIQLIRHDDGWKDLKAYFHANAWRQSMYWRGEYTLNLVWHLFSSRLEKQGAKYGSVELSTLKHLVRLSVGALPAFEPISSNILAPIQALQKAFIDIYRINYIPTFMLPWHWASKAEFPAYYSINKPTLLESTPRRRKFDVVVQVMREVNELIGLFRAAVFEKDFLMLENTPLYESVEQVKYKFFHGSDPHKEFESTHRMPLTDPRLKAMPKGYEKKSFCEAGPFIRGCIQLTSN